MSTSQHVVGGPSGTPPGSSADPRVRDRAREAVAVMAFSAVTSGTLAGALLLLTQLGR
jgi:hypothetical protein